MSVENLKEKEQKIKELSEELNSNKMLKFSDEVDKLYDKVNEIDEIIDEIKNIPEELELRRIEINQTLNDRKLKIEEIEKEYNEHNFKSSRFGKVLNNTALTWLGSGALVGGSGGIKVGSILLGLDGPISWGGIAGLSLVYSDWSFISVKNEKEILENIFIKILNNSETKLKLGISEINERIKYIYNEVEMLEKSKNETLGYHKDYNNLTEIQKNRITNCLNRITDSIKLITAPIKGLSQNFNDNDYINYKGDTNDVKKKNLFVLLANILENIYLNEEERKIFVKYILNNENFFKNNDIRKEDMSLELLSDVCYTLYPKKDYIKKNNFKEVTKKQITLVTLKGGYDLNFNSNLVNTNGINHINIMLNDREKELLGVKNLLFNDQIINKLEESLNETKILIISSVLGTDECRDAIFNIVEVAQKFKIKTFGYFQLPFQFEGTSINQNAKNTFEELTNVLDSCEAFSREYIKQKNIKLNISSAFSLYSILLNDFIKNIKLIMLLQQ